MLKQFMVWASICSTAPVMCAQNHNPADSTACDTAQYPISPTLLDEIVVTAATTISKIDRKVIRPCKEAMDTSSDGIDLLRKLQLPGIAINPLTGEIAGPGGGTVALCINGVPSTPAQISAIRPQDILRIEYHDSPGIRYSGSCAVIDYITSRHDTGGSVQMDAFGVFGPGRYASIDHFACQYNQGQSVWNVNVGFMGQQKDKWIRDYEETWHYPDAVVTRQESGLPVKVGGSGLESRINYNYMHPHGNILDLQLGFDLNDVPNQEEGDRHAMLVTSATQIPVEIIEHTEEYSLRPGLGVYYLQKLNDRQNLTVDISGSYLKSKMIHAYSENGKCESSKVTGGKYSVTYLAMSEYRIGNRVWNAGVSGDCSFVRNVYDADDRVMVSVNQSRTAIAGEYSDLFGDWGVRGSLKAVYDRLGQKDRNTGIFFLSPAVNVSWRPGSGWFLRYAASLDYKMPSAPEISAVEQPVQTGMIRRGNPALKPFRIIEQTISAAFGHPLISIDTRMEYHNEHNPVMESVIFEKDRFVKTYLNQRSFRRLRTSISVSIRPWQDHLSVTAGPMLTHYISHGIDYTHHHNIFRMGLSVDFNYGRWLVYGNIMSGPANRMYGEEIIEEKDMNQIMAGYKHDKWSLHVGVFNAFMRNYWMEIRNLSALTPYTSKARSGRSSTYVAIRFNLALDFGRKGREADVRHTESGNDSEILTGTR